MTLKSIIKRLVKEEMYNKQFQNITELWTYIQTLNLNVYYINTLWPGKGRDSFDDTRYMFHYIVLSKSEKEANETVNIYIGRTQKVWGLQNYQWTKYTIQQLNKEQFNEYLDEYYYDEWDDEHFIKDINKLLTKKALELPEGA